MFGIKPLPRTLEAALRDVRNPSFKVRQSAIGDLARHASSDDDENPVALAGREKAVAELLRLLVEEPHLALRREVAVAIGAAKLRGVEPSLIKATDDVSGAVSQMALWALGEVSAESEEAKATVEAFLETDSPPHRFQALLSLAQMDFSRAVPWVVKALKEEDEEICYLAVRLLDEHGVLDSASAPGRAQVEKALEHQSPRIRIASAIALARQEPKLAAPHLASALNHRRPIADPEDEQAAIELAGELGVKEAIPGLERRAFGGIFFGGHRFAWHSMASLARLGHERACAQILRGISAFSRDRRQLSVAAAGAARLLPAKPLLERLAVGAVDEALRQEALAKIGGVVTEPKLD